MEAPATPVSSSAPTATSCHTVITSLAILAIVCYHELPSYFHGEVQRLPLVPRTTAHRLLGSLDPSTSAGTAPQVVPSTTGAPSPCTKLVTTPTSSSASPPVPSSSSTQPFIDVVPFDSRIPCPADGCDKHYAQVRIACIDPPVHSRPVG